jgi:transposase
MYLRRCYRKKDGKRHGYWALVESYRSSRGPRQRVVAYLGEMDAAGRLGIQQQAAGVAAVAQRGLFRDVEPQWVEVDLKRIAIERKRAFGGPWIGLELCRQVGLVDFLEQALPTGREEIPWPVMALILILARLCDPSSELRIAEHFYEASALSDLLGVPANKVNEDRLYRCLDQLLPHKEELERHLKNRLGEPFDLDYDLMLYDVTSTYFEGEAKRNGLAQRGYSRDHRPDCKQVNIALVVSREGMPLGYQLFTGNRNDVTTLEDIVERIERPYGRANRIWVLDRGMVSEENVRYLKQAKRRYIVGTPKGVLKRFEGELRAPDWHRVREGLEVRFCPAPGGEEVFLLCRSAQRKEKEQAMHERFEKRIEEGLEKIVASCRKRKQLPAAVGQRVGRLLGQNSRAARAFEVQIDPDVDGFAKCHWKRIDRWREWARLSEGCYVLRSNVTDWSPEELWRAYMQLTEAEAAFRIQKTDLQLRPIWHQKQERVEAHILMCFLTFVLWKTLAQLCQRAGLGNEPRKVFQELADITLVDVVLPTRNGVTIRKRCISRPTQHQAILLQHLNLHLPNSLGVCPRFSI